jgi:RHS repeat-associated protein
MLTSKSQAFFAYNGMMKDDEIQGVGNSYTTEFRQYDARLGRWTAVDPLNEKYPDVSPYVFCANNPIINIDGDGREVIPTNSFKSVGKLTSMLSIASKTEVYKQLISAYSSGEYDLYLGYNPSTSSKIAVTDLYEAGKGNNYTRTFSVTYFFNFDIKMNGTDEIVGTKDFSSDLLVSTLFHELIHANINLYELGVTLSDDRYSKFKIYFDKYKNKTNPALAEHEFIADNFRDDIAEGMKQFDREQNTPLREDRYYAAMAWGGLTTYRDQNKVVHETDAWIKFKSQATEEEINYINEVLEDENNRIKTTN